MRLDVVQEILDAGVQPLNYTDVMELVGFINACQTCGVHANEFTNRGKVLYLPGCAIENEISNAEELGAEICKIFTGGSAGGPGFICTVMAICPWHRFLPTVDMDAAEVSISNGSRRDLLRWGWEVN